MTGPDQPGGADEPAEPITPTDPAEPTEEGSDSSAADRPAARPGARTFTLEGRVAPGLFVGGWLAFLMGAGCIVVALLAASGELAVLGLLVVGLGLMTAGLVLGAGSQALERRARGVSAYWGPSPFLVFAAVVTSSALATLVVGRPAVALGLDPASPAATLLALALEAAAATGLIRLLVVGQGALRWTDMGLERRPLQVAAGDIAWGVMLMIPALFATLFLSGVLLLLLPAPNVPIVPATRGPDIVLNVLAAAAIAPIWEELFFRGFATTAWARSMPIGKAMIRGALFFAAVHTLGVGGTDFADGLGRAAFAFIVRLPVAYGFELVFVRRRSLVASISMHASFNTILILLQVAGSGI